MKTMVILGVLLILLGIAILSHHWIKESSSSYSRYFGAHQSSERLF